MPSLILASQSPRRVELIAHLVNVYRLAHSNVEDTGSDLWPEWEMPRTSLPTDFHIPQESHPTLWAWRKAIDVSLHKPLSGQDAVVLGADTVVVGPGMLLGKPGDNESAMRMLQGLRGRKHYVVTGYALVMRNGEQVETLHAEATVSDVWMRDFTDEELEAYIATGESLDKAGAYALQGLGGKLVDRIEGCYKNVVGLPLCEVRRALEVTGVELLPYPEDGYCRSCPRVEKR